MHTRTRLLLTALVLPFWPPSPARAQDMPKDQYFRYLPLEVSRLVRQTRASRELHLYGGPSDPAFTDTDPVDGIDDRRNRVFAELGVRFAPFMVMNTTNVPMDWRFFARDRDVFNLHVDWWNTVGEGGTLVREETVNLVGTATDPCASLERFMEIQKDDCRLLDLLHDYDPDEPASALERARAMEPDQDLFRVLYTDFPGAGEARWRAEFTDPSTGQLPLRYRGALGIYLHPFIVERTGQSGERGYELLLQYWFFYPYNDGGNNHKGDWEHINVVISPRDRVTRLLTADEVGRLLDGVWLAPSSPDQALVIKRIDYYFHNKVFALDFASPNVYLDREAWEAEVDAKSAERISEDWFWRQVRRRAYRDDAETVVNTHPVVHIGADNKGYDQILAMPGGKNRDSHGSFPFPGLYKDIGPGGATEEISTYFDHRAFFSASAAERERTLNRWKRGGVVWLAEQGRIQVLPDWEVLRDPVRLDPDVRQEWGWFLLPIRFGYPASESPFAGIVAHAETGNISILGPSFSSGWNRAGASAGFASYAPHKVPRLFPLGIQDGFRNSWGFFNVFTVLTVLPPIDVVWRLLAAPVRGIAGRQDPTFYPAETIPYRFVGLSGGVSSQAVPEDFVDLVFASEPFDAFIGSLLAYVLINGDSTTRIVSEEVFTERATAPYGQLSLFLGSRFSSENVLRHSRSDVGSRLDLSNIDEPYELRGALNFWEYAGSMRYNLATGALLPYGKAGYGVSHYRLEDLTGAGEPLTATDTPWNTRWTWHLGAGLELLTIRSFSPAPRGVDLSFRGDWTVYWHGLGLDVSDLDLETLVLLGATAETLPRDRTVTRHEFRLGLTVSF